MLQSNLLDITSASPGLAIMQAGGYAVSLEQEITQLRQQLYATENPTDRLPRKVIVKSFLVLLTAAGVTLANTDRSKIVRLIAALSGFSEKSIEKVFVEDTELGESHREDVLRVNKLLNDVKLPAIKA